MLELQLFQTLKLTPLHLLGLEEELQLNTASLTTETMMDLSSSVEPLTANIW